jgi:hypothetical protein
MLHRRNIYLFLLTVVVATWVISSLFLATCNPEAIESEPELMELLKIPTIEDPITTSLPPATTNTNTTTTISGGDTNTTGTQTTSNTTTTSNTSTSTGTTSNSTTSTTTTTSTTSSSSSSSGQVADITFTLTESNITFSTATAGATIYYTLDGSDPATSGTAVNGASPLTVSPATSPVHFRVVGKKTGYTNSQELEMTYEFSYS